MFSGVYAYATHQGLYDQQAKLWLHPEISSLKSAYSLIAPPLILIETANERPNGNPSIFFVLTSV